MMENPVADNDQRSRVDSIRSYLKRVDLKKEIENRISNHTPGIEKEFIHRVVVFSLSGTDIVDLKAEKEEGESDASSVQSRLSCTARIANRLPKSLIANLLTQIVFSKRKIDTNFVQSSRTQDGYQRHMKSKMKPEDPLMDIKNGDKIILSNNFQDLIEVTLFGLSVSSIN